jgi:uncharacterized protein
MTALVPQELQRKQNELFEGLRALDSLAVALSGGADSAYLAWAAHQALGERSLSVTALSSSFSAHDREEVERFVRLARVRHVFIETHEFENPLYVANNADRCYHCKAELFTKLEALAATRGIRAIAYGINADEVGDFRPGHRAASEHQVLTPLLDAHLTKAEIRELSRAAGLPTWDRPASPCLSSRIPYGTAVTPEALSRIEQAEAVLRKLGYRQFRVRHFGDVARLEIGADEMPRAMESGLARLVAADFEQLGFRTVELDPAGYRQGSLNAALKVSSGGT